MLQRVALFIALCLTIASAAGAVAEGAAELAVPSCSQALEAAHLRFDGMTSHRAADTIRFDKQNPEVAQGSTALISRVRSIAVKTLDSVHTCPSGPNRDVLRAYAAAYRGFVGYFDESPGWHDDVSLASQLFSACVRRSAGTTIGARCGSALDRVDSWRATWAR